MINGLIIALFFRSSTMDANRSGHVTVRSGLVLGPFFQDQDQTVQGPDGNVNRSSSGPVLVLVRFGPVFVLFFFFFRLVDSHKCNVNEQMRLWMTLAMKSRLHERYFGLISPSLSLNPTPLLNLSCSFLFFSSLSTFLQ